MISEAQESSLAQSRAAARQNREIPFLINVKDGRLVPNTPGNANLSSYRPFLGDYKAPLTERMAYLKSSGVGRGRVQVTNSAAEPAVFDIGKATKDELIAFAFDNFQSVLVDAPLGTLRKQVAELAKAADSLA